ncbi:MAG: hypothetical protein EOP56_07045 [Sphingobacteriales bacterium]|nr:MAG: hypothetical protein EOP56_07045 [Sphingobacteriales bacterium]
MKSLYVLAAYLLTILWIPEGFAQVTKEKKFSGRFSADRGKLVIDNHYGKLDINTWDKNEITVDITVTAKARTESGVQQILDKVSIQEPGKADGIYYKTVIGKGKTLSISSKNEFRIDYVINMPRRHNAEFINRFGDIDLADVDGKVKIDLDYGGLKAGNIRGTDNDIRIGFGSASIAFIESGYIKSAYSKLTINKAGSLKISNEFEKTTIGTIRDLDIKQRYGNLNIGSVNQLKGSAEFDNLTVDKLLKSVQMDLKYCGNARFEYIGADVDKIDINSSFSNMHYHFDNAASLSANMEVSFGKVKNGVDGISLAESKPDKYGQTSIYKGKIGGGRGSMNLDVSYGNVVFK